MAAFRQQLVAALPLHQRLILRAASSGSSRQPDGSLCAQPGASGRAVIEDLPLVVESHNEGELSDLVIDPPF